MNCNICGCEDFDKKRIDFKKWGRTYYKCNNCQFIFCDENDILTEKEESKKYEKHNNFIDDPEYRAYFKRFIDEVREYIPKGSQILDYGSGPEPVLADVFKELGYSPKTYDKYFNENSKYKDFNYDVITSTEVFEHIYRPMEVLKDLDKLLNRNGHIILMTNFHYNDWERFRNWWYMKDLTHIVFFNERTFEVLAKELNYEVVYNNNKNIVVLRKR